MDQEMRERFTRIETQMETLMDLVPKQTEKLDAVLQLQVTIAGMHEVSRSHGEKLHVLFEQDKDQNGRYERLEHRVNAAINWGRGVLAVLVVLFPVVGWVFVKQYEQLATIDRRLTWTEYALKAPIPEGK